MPTHCIIQKMCFLLLGLFAGPVTLSSCDGYTRGEITFGCPWFSDLKFSSQIKNISFYLAALGMRN